jgi:hypothetical protein
MSLGAWIMLIIGAVAIYGGLIYCIILTTTRGKAHEYSDVVETDNGKDNDSPSQENAEVQN